MKVVGSVVRVRYEDGWVSMSSTKTSNMLLQPLEHLSLGQVSFGDLPASGGSISEDEDPSRTRSESPTSSASPQRGSPVGGLMDVKTLSELDITSLDDDGAEASRTSPQQVGQFGLGRSDISDDVLSSKQRRSSSSRERLSSNGGESGMIRRSGSSSDLLSSKRRSSASRERRSVNGRERRSSNSREGPPTMSFTFEARKGKDGKNLPLGIGWAPRTSDPAMAHSAMRQSTRVGDDFSGEMIIVQEIRPGHLAAMYAEQGLSEGLVLVEIQQVSVVGKSYPEFLELVTKHMDARPLTLKFRHDDEDNQEEQQAAAFSVIPFAIRASQVSDLWSIKYGSQLDGIADAAEKVVVIQDVTEAHTTVYKGVACTLKPGMVLQGVSGQPVAGRTYSDVMGMIYEAFIRSQIEHKQEQLAEEFASQEADTLIREMGRGGKQPAPPAPPTPVATPDGEKLIRPAPPRPYRMCNGELVALPATSAGSYVLEFEAVALPSEVGSGKPDPSTLAPRILQQQRLIEVTSKEPVGIDLVEVECPSGGSVVVVGHLDYSSKATRKLEDQGLAEGMVLIEVNGIPVVSAAAAEAAEDSDSDETPPYTLSDVAELFTAGLRPLVLSFEGEFDEDSEDNQLAPRLVDPKLDMKTPLMQKTFDVKRGSMSKMLKLRVGDMGIQVETKDSRDDLPSWDSFLFKNLERGRVDVRGRKLYIRSGTQAPPVILTCKDNQAKEIQQLVDIKIRELRKVDRYEKLRAKEARAAAVQLQQQSTDGTEEQEQEPEPELESQPQSDASAIMHASAGEEHRQDGGQPQGASRQKSLDQATRADPASGTGLLGTMPTVKPLKLLSLSPTGPVGQGPSDSDSPRLSGSPFPQHTTPRSLGEMVAWAESSRHSTDSTGSAGTPRVGSLGTGSATVGGSPRLSPHRTPPSASAAAAAANGNGWGDFTNAQKRGRTVSGGTDSQGQATPSEGVPPSPTCVSSRFPALPSMVAEWVVSASTPANKSLYDVPDFEQPRLLATKMRLCATTVADITARALEESQTSVSISGRNVGGGAGIVAVAEAYVAEVIWPAQHDMLRDIKDFVSVRNKLNQEISGAIATPRSNDTGNGNGSGGAVRAKCSLFELGVHLLASHLIRPVAPTVEDFFGPDSDEEDVTLHADSNDGFDYSAAGGSRRAATLPAEPCWPTLSLVYEFAYRFFMSHDISAEDAEEMLCPDPTTAASDGQGRRLLNHLVPLLEYAGEEERAALIRLLKLLVNRFGSTKNKRVVKLLLQSTGSACVTLAYDSSNGLSSCAGYGRHRGLSELLDLALTLIGRWRAPLLAYQQQFVIRSLGALHTLPVESLRGCHEALKECQFTAIDKAGADGGHIAASLLRGCLLRRWPRQSVEKQELFLEEMEGLLPHVPPAELFSLGGELGATLGVCLRSPHVEPVLGALYLITAEDVEGLFSDAAAEAATERCAWLAEGSAEQPVNAPVKALTGLAALVAQVERGSASGAERESEEAGSDTQKPLAPIGKQVEELFDTLQKSLKAVLAAPDVAHYSESQNRQIIEMAHDAADMLNNLNGGASEPSTDG